jgi:hypothetical protein
MAFNISEFKTNIEDYGYIKNNKFEVFVQSPAFLQNRYLVVNGKYTNISDMNNLLRFRIEQVKMPGISLNSIDTNRYGIGPTQKMPYNAQFVDTGFSILLDRNTDLWDFWYNWVNGIFNFNGQEPDGNNIFTGGRIPNYVTEYKDNYASNMMIVLYDDLKRVIKKINLYEAFPSSIRDIPLSWADTNNNLIALSVSITFSSYSIVGSSLNSNLEQL